jgi:hypothetical protein
MSTTPDYRVRSAGTEDGFCSHTWSMEFRVSTFFDFDTEIPVVLLFMDCSVVQVVENILLVMVISVWKSLLSSK